MKDRQPKKEVRKPVVETNEKPEKNTNKEGLDKLRDQVISRKRFIEDGES